MSRIALIVALALLWAVPAAGQPMDPNMPGMTMPAAKPAAKPKTKPPAPAPAPANPHAGHDMSAMPGMDMPKAGSPSDQPVAADAESEPEIPHTPPPPAPTDHAADRLFDPARMAAARAVLREEHGGAPYSKVMANLLEHQSGAGGGYRWEGEAMYGGDINRFVVKTEGEGSRRDGLESAEVQGLYGRAISRYFDLQAGVRQDFKPHARTYLTVGTEGLFPYWFDVSGAAFLSTRGEMLGRVEGTYDLRLAQRLVLQPRAELNFAAQDTRATRTGSGLSNAELGLRLRYEIKREFAPYIGVSYDRRFGKTADYARAAGESAEATSLVVGLRAWF
jgi:copper resistance protein B